MIDSHYQMIHQRIRITTFLCVLVVIVIIGRLYFLQVIRHDVLVETGRVEKTRNITWKPERGVIFDRNMRLMVWNSKFDTLVAHPGKIQDPTQVASCLHPILGMPEKTLIDILSKDRDEVALRRRVSSTVVNQIKDEIKEKEIKGLGFIQEPGRHYVKGKLAGQVLGYVNIDNKGEAGIEKEQEPAMTIDPIKLSSRRVGDRRAILENDYTRDLPLRGNDIVLTVDETIQWITEKALGTMCLDQKAKGGMALVLDPYTGEVLAMANYPFFDADRMDEVGNIASAKNQCISNLYEPGSTIKPIIVAAGLDCGAIQLDTIIDCENGKRYLPARLRPRPIEDEHPMGSVSITEILVHSSNIGAGKIAEMIRDLAPDKPTNQRFYNYLRAFGFGARTDMDLSHETFYQLTSFGKWNMHDLLVIAFGTGPIMTTPIGLAKAYCILANGGTQIRPHVVRKYFKSRYGEEVDSPKGSMERVIQEEVAHQVCRMLIETVERGTGKKARSNWYKTGGKTGTALKWVNGGYSSAHRVLSFAGIAPENPPRIVVIVMIDEPQEFRFGAEAAAPVFREIVDETLAYLHVTPDFLEPRLETKPKKKNEQRQEHEETIQTAWHNRQVANAQKEREQH